jgi:dTDP-L-rhamnose 4-epimerase
MIFGETYETEAVALRLFNVFGAGQALSNPYTGVLANFASRIAQGARPTVFEDGAQRRDFVHVEDVARAFRLAWERPEAAGEVFNVGSGRAYTITEVAELLAARWGARPRARDPRPRAGGRHPQLLRRHRARTEDPRVRARAAARRLARALRGLGAGQTVEDRNAEMRRHLEARRLVS